MSEKIKNYIDVLFSDIPRTKKAIELKEELLSNMNERFDDYMREGKSEVQSYSLVLANMGDIDDLLAEVMPDADFKKEAQFYKNRKARNTAIGVVLYILSIPILVIFTVIFFTPILGVVIFLSCVALATGFIVYASMSTPLEYKGVDTKINREKTSKGRIFESIVSLYWSIVVVSYLLISFATDDWDITWIIFPIAAILAKIIKLMYDIRNEDDN